MMMLGPQHLNMERSQQLVRYVEDYLECVESLPLDIQRNVSVLREIDSKYQGKVRADAVLRSGTSSEFLVSVGCSQKEPS